MVQPLQNCEFPLDQELDFVPAWPEVLFYLLYCHFLLVFADPEEDPAVLPVSDWFHDFDALDVEFVADLAKVLASFFLDHEFFDFLDGVFGHECEEAFFLDRENDPVDMKDHLIIVKVRIFLRK